LTIENASKLAFQCGPAIHVRELREDHLANIAKMKNLENLFCFLCQFDHGYEVILRPFMDILQSNCFKIRSLEVDHWDNERNSLGSEVIALIEEYLPSISTVTMHVDDLKYLEDYYCVFKNLKKLVLDFERYGYFPWINAKTMTDVFPDGPKENQIKEIHVKGCPVFLKEKLIPSYKEFFPHLEKLIIDQSGGKSSCHWAPPLKCGN
jgi:hypothetical protein